MMRADTGCACGSDAASGVVRKAHERRYGMPGDFLLLRCVDCGLVRTSPQPTQPAQFYPPADYYSYQPPSPPSGRVRRRIRWAYSDRPVRRTVARAAARWLLPGTPPGPPGRILDVGCGSGAFLLAMREAGWDPYGVEISPRAVAAAHEAGLDQVIVGDLLECPLPEERFDAIRFWHVLEHVADPKAQLLKARALLQRGGTLMIGVPNYASLLSRVSRNGWFYLDVPRHLWHFDRHSLRELVTSAGFRVERLRTESTSTPLLGTIDFALKTDERLLSSRRAFYAGLPVEALLDTVGFGDALVVTARSQE
jgi:SAM-dependent methyltransferase